MSGEFYILTGENLTWADRLGDSSSIKFIQKICETWKMFHISFEHQALFSKDKHDCADQNCLTRPTSCQVNIVPRLTNGLPREEIYLQVSSDHNVLFPRKYPYVPQESLFWS